MTLRGPGGFVRIDGGGVAIDGGSVRIKEGGAPGEGHGSSPALPIVPLRSDEERERRRLPLVDVPAFPNVPRGKFPGRGLPLNEHELFICGLICECKDAPRPGLCVRQILERLDQTSGGMSRYKTEVTYDVSKTPPELVMSNNDPSRPTSGSPKGSRKPDVVVVKDPTKLPTQDNIEEVIEIKFDEPLPDHQLEAYQRIAGEPRKLRVLDPKECGCPSAPKRKVKVTAEDVLKVVATVVAGMLLLSIMLQLLGRLAPLLI